MITSLLLTIPRWLEFIGWMAVYFVAGSLIIILIFIAIFTYNELPPKDNKSEEFGDEDEEENENGKNASEQ